MTRASSQQRSDAAERVFSRHPGSRPPTKRDFTTSKKSVLERIMANTFKFDSVSDDVLLQRLLEILKESRRVEVELVAHIGEVDRRRLYADHASR